MLKSIHGEMSMNTEHKCDMDMKIFMRDMPENPY